MIGNITGKKAMDLACGTGKATFDLPALGASKVVGVDISSGNSLYLIITKFSLTYSYFIFQA